MNGAQGLFLGCEKSNCRSFESSAAADSLWMTDYLCARDDSFLLGGSGGMEFGEDFLDGYGYGLFATC